MSRAEIVLVLAAVVIVVAMFVLAVGRESEEGRRR